MLLDMDKVKVNEGYTIGAIQHREHTYGVVTIPSQEGFHKLVGFMLPTGVWGWVHKNYRKAL